MFKYYYYQKPILGLINSGSVLSYELAKSRNYPIPKKNHIAIADFLTKAFSDYPNLLNFDHDYWKSFTSNNVVNKYTSIIYNILSKHNIDE